MMLWHDETSVGRDAGGRSGGCSPDVGTVQTGIGRENGLPARDVPGRDFSHDHASYRFAAVLWWVLCCAAFLGWGVLLGGPW